MQYHAVEKRDDYFKHWYKHTLASIRANFSGPPEELYQSIMLIDHNSSDRRQKGLSIYLKQYPFRSFCLRADHIVMFALHRVTAESTLLLTHE